MKKILVADDDPGTREFYEALFGNSGYQILAIGDPAGVALCGGNFDPDLLLLDWDMPGGGGKKVYELMRVCQGRKVPVIFATGFPEKVTINSGPEVVVLKKPVNAKVLLAEARRLIGEP
ncbi:MAG: response regulator [Elusimicrobia bacterium]|nr:response regulator [Elusimicrobiota bacterium]